MLTDLHFLAPVVDALGWTLVHFLWQGAVIGVLFAVIMRWMAAASSDARYLVGIATLALMLAAPVATFLVLWDGTPPVAQAHVVDVAAVSAVAASPAAFSGWEAFQGRIDQAMPWAVAAWILGVFVLTFRLTLDALRVRRVVREAIQPLETALQGAADRLCKEMRIARTVRVLESARVSVPMVIGWIRPVILVPTSAVVGLTPLQLELILRHELAHIRRYDFIVNVCQLVVDTLLFFHPAVRMVSNRVRAEREHCCDDMVVAHTGDGLAYARALTEVEDLRCSTGMPLALAATGGHLMGRVRRIVALPGPQAGSMHWYSGVTLVATSVMVLLSTDLSLTPRGSGADAYRETSLVLPAAAPAPLRAAPRGEEPPTLTGQSPMPAAAPAADATRREAVVETVEPAPVTVRATSVPRSDPPAAPAPAPVAREVVEDIAEAPVLADEIAPAVEAVDAAPVVDELPAPPLETVADTAAEAAPAVKPAEPKLTGGALRMGSQPDFPRHARIAGTEGYVHVAFDVDVDGKVRNIEVRDAFPPKTFEAPVKRALKRWRFEPFRQDGSVVTVGMQHTFVFEIPDEQSVAEADDGRCKKVTGTRICRRGARGYEEMNVAVIYNEL